MSFDEQPPSHPLSLASLLRLDDPASWRGQLWDAGWDEPEPDGLRPDPALLRAAMRHVSAASALPLGGVNPSMPHAADTQDTVTAQALVALAALARQQGRVARLAVDQASRLRVGVVPDWSEPDGVADLLEAWASALPAARPTTLVLGLPTAQRLEPETALASLLQRLAARLIDADALDVDLTLFDEDLELAAGPLDLVLDGEGADWHSGRPAVIGPLTPQRLRRVLRGVSSTAASPLEEDRTAPVVSVVMTTHDNGPVLLRAAASVLGQTIRRVELLVWDDGSTDPETLLALDLLTLVSSVRVVRSHNQGVAAARNAGGGLTSAPLLCWLDPDDLLLPTYLHSAAAVLTVRPDVDLAYSFVEVSGEGQGVWITADTDPHQLPYVNTVPVCALLRREVLTGTGGFSEVMHEGYEDWDLWARAARAGFRGVVVAQPLFRYTHRNSTGRDSGARTRHAELAERVRARAMAVEQAPRPAPAGVPLEDVAQVNGIVTHVVTVEDGCVAPSTWSMMADLVAAGQPPLVILVDAVAEQEVALLRRATPFVMDLRPALDRSEIDRFARALRSSLRCASADAPQRSRSAGKPLPIAQPPVQVSR